MYLSYYISFILYIFHILYLSYYISFILYIFHIIYLSHYISFTLYIFHIIYLSSYISFILYIFHLIYLSYYVSKYSCVDFKILLKSIIYPFSSNIPCTYKFQPGYLSSLCQKRLSPVINLIVSIQVHTHIHT